MKRESQKKRGIKEYFNFLYHGKLQQISLRNRLYLAFVILIISSASATIMIGSTVFGRKVEELARGKVNLYNNIASQVFNLYLEKMRLLAGYVASQAGTKDDDQKLFAKITKEGPLDFIAFFRQDRLSIARPKTYPSISSQPLFDITTLPPDIADHLKKSAIGRPLELAISSNSAISGVTVVPDHDLALLGFAEPAPESMLMLAAAPIGDSNEVVLLGWVLNGRRDIFSGMVDLISPPEAEIIDATIFLQDKRIATTLGDRTIDTVADTEVSEAVLGRNQTFSGKANVVGTFFFTFYTPIQNFDGDIIGMIGAGTNENVYNEVKRRTTLFFSSLIAGGMIFGFLMTFLFSFWLIMPVTSLAEGMSRVAEGDLNYKVRLSTKDELGRLALAFNKMVKAVKERDHRLREMTENRLSAVEKQISIGRLAAGVAHEINNPLTAILSLSRLMLKHTPEDDPQRNDLKIIVTETTRCREIVRSLLDFARESQADKSIVNINQVVADTVSLAGRYDAMDELTVNLELAPTALLVDADPKMLQQVFTNILLNAAEAIDKKGTIKITTEEDSSGSFVLIHIMDTGKGIPEEHINRIFEPFFTTKGTSKGTGLGLSVSVGIIRKHDGEIEISSSEGEGTTVTVTLPRMSLS